MWWIAVTAAGAADLTTLSVELGRPSHGVVAGVVERPLAEVVELAADCEGSSSWFPDVRDTRVVSDDGVTVRCSGRTDLPWPLADRVWQIDTTIEDHGDVVVVAFTLVEGNLDALQGGYVLEDLGDGRTSITYEAWVDLGFWVPEALVDWATRRVLPEIVRGIEVAPLRADTFLARR